MTKAEYTFELKDWEIHIVIYALMHFRHSANYYKNNAECQKETDMLIEKMMKDRYKEHNAI